MIMQLLTGAAALVIIVLLTFRGAFDNNFVDWDDFTYVVNNKLVRDTGNTTVKDVFTTPVSSNYHPLTILSMRMNNNECSGCPEGISPAPFIRWNIILHVLNTILVFFLVWLLTARNMFAALLVAAIFGIHPMHVESVAWISERKDVLYSFFFLAGLLSYIHFKQEKKNFWLVITFVLFILSCLSKAVAVVFPLMMILINYWLDERELKPGNIFTGKSFAILLPFFIVSLVTGLVAYRIQNGQDIPGLVSIAGSTPDVVDATGSYSVWEKFRNATYGFSAYIIKFLAPFRLSAFYPYPGSPELESKTYTVLLGIAPLAFLLVSAAAMLSLRKVKIVAFGLAFYFVAVVFVLQFIPVGYAIIADRYSYLPYIGLAIIPAYLIAGSGKFRKPLLAASLLFVAMLFILSQKQVKVWENTESLWSNTIDKFPDAEIARRSRGKLYSKIALGSSNPVVRRNYEDKALADFQAAIRSGSKNAEVYEGAGVIIGSKGEPEKAVKYFDVALKIDSVSGSIFYNRALTLSKTGRYSEAIEDYTSALRFSPEKAVRIRTNRANLLLQEKRFSEAIDDLDYLIRNGREDFNNYYNRAVSKQFTNDISGAVADYRKALEIDPGDEAAKKQLADLLRISGSQ